MRRSAKKICMVLMAAAVLICSLSGCVRMEVGLNIQKDGSADVGVSMGVTEDLYAMLTQDGQDPMAEVKSKAEESGYTAEEYEQDGYKGLTMTQHIADLQQATQASDPYMEGLSFTKEKNGLREMMTLSGAVNTAESMKENLDGMTVDLSQFDVKLTVTVPYAITESNATEISEDGKTATWDLMTVDTINLTCEGDVLLFGMPVAAALGIVGALAVVAIVLIVVGAVRKNRARKAQADGMAEPPVGEDGPEE